MIEARAWRLAVLCLATSVALACASSKEPGAPETSDAATPASADGEAQQASPTLTAEPAAEPAAKSEDEASPAGLDELQQQLANKSSRLRALGVDMPAHAEGEAEAAPREPAREQQPPAQRQDTRKKEAKGKKNKPAGKPSKQPSTKPSSADGFDDLAGGGGVAPDEAKSVRLSPEGEPEGASACVQICALSLGTCELRGAICELADRHDDEPDYRAACERADEDCVVAEEACRACSE